MRGFPTSKFRCYVSFRRSLRAPHHIGGCHFTSTDGDEAGIFAHLHTPPPSPSNCDCRPFRRLSLFVHVTSPQGGGHRRGSRRQAEAVKNLSNCLGSRNCCDITHAAATTIAFENVHCEHAAHQFGPAIIARPRRMALFRATLPFRDYLFALFREPG